MDMNNELEIFRKIKNGNAEEQLARVTSTYSQEEFPGKLPVRVLKYNFLERYNHFSSNAESTLQRITAYKLSDKIKWFVESEQFRYPCCKFCSDGSCQIQISEKYFSYLWCVTYSFLLYYERQAQANPNATINDELRISSEMIGRAQQLFSWAISLPNSSADWDLNLPNPSPTANLIDSEALYCLYANNLSVNALVFVLYHELGHAFMGYDDNKDDCKRNELDADIFAIDLMRDPKGEVTYQGANLGILIALCSNLFLNMSTPPKLSSKTHPDGDVRIIYAIERFVDANDPAFHNYYYFILIIFRLFSQMYKIESKKDIMNHPDFETTEEALQYFADLFARYKD